jgi:hypothetical protein
VACVLGVARVIRLFAAPHDGRILSRRQWLRREMLRLGTLGGMGLAAPALRALQAAAPPAARRLPGFGRARSVIVVFANGGQSHLDTWDPKPEAPEQIRGAFASIATSVPGVRVCEHLPRVARLAGELTIVRSVTHDDLDHGSASYLALTGHFHPRKSSNPPPTDSDLPTYGAVLARVRPSRRFPHTAVHVNGPAMVPKVIAPGQFAGLLGREYEPLIVGDLTDPEVALPELALQPGLSPQRLARRRQLLQELEPPEAESEAALQAWTILRQQAFEVLNRPECQRAFNLGEEPPAVRERYGEYRSGQACLLARRLVEAGVPLVTVMFNHTNRGQDDAPDNPELYGWDTHNDIFESLGKHLLPRFDWTFSALLEDLQQRGLLDETLVVCMGEFGRAPLVAYEAKFAGSSPGRKHWASAYSIVMAGAGVARGAVYGSSNRIGAVVEDAPVTPGDIAATLFHALGIDPAQHYHDALGRRFPIATGRPIVGLYA